MVISPLFAKQYLRFTSAFSILANLNFLSNKYEDISAVKYNYENI